jgi:hypothetical protein
MARNLSAHASTDTGGRSRKKGAHAESVELLIVLDLSVFAETVENGHFSSTLRRQR